MAEKKSQTLVRADPADLAKWKEAATIRGLSLNQWVIDAANGRVVDVVGAALDAFAERPATTGNVAATAVPDPLLAFDLALNETPTLTGQRRWVDPQALRENYERLLKA